MLDEALISWLAVTAINLISQVTPELKWRYASVHSIMLFVEVDGYEIKRCKNNTKDVISNVIIGFSSCQRIVLFID